MRACVAFAVLAASGCGLIAFDVDQDLPPQMIQGSVLGGLLPSFLAPTPLHIDIKSETQKRDTGPASSANLKLLRFQLTPHDAPSGNFDFLDEVHIFIESPSNGALARREIATLAPVPKGATTLTLTIVPGIDLLPYINAGAQITATATGREPSMNVTFDGHITVTVHI
jgi:hypothetical protein